MGINNPDIRLVLQWVYLINFDFVIQRIGRVGRKKGQVISILFISK